MKSPVWTKALKNSADPARARQFLDQLSATDAGHDLAKASAEQARILCALFSGSHALSAWLVANPEALSILTPELLQHPRRIQGLRRDADGLVQSGDSSAALDRLRHFKQGEMLRIAARDLARIANTNAIILELSDVADVCLGLVLRLCHRQLVSRFGEPFHQDPDGRWIPTAFCVLGMGKLGGQELNYSSDVDVLFVYADEGHVFKDPPGRVKPPTAGLASHQFFKRLAESFIAEVSRVTDEGSFYRIDLRLRPEGDSGPLARSIESFENYYSQWGQTWERMMLIKARCVAGSEALAAEFLEMIQPFRYPRSISAGVLGEIAAVKDRIETEIVKSDELDRDVKRGRGGIREIEFVAQSLQLLHAGRHPFVQGPQTLPALEKLVEYNFIDRAQSSSLADAYLFLRDVEHRLQMEDNLQTHTIPDADVPRARLAALMGFKKLAAFEAALKAHTTAVRRVYDGLFKADSPPTPASLPRDISGDESKWKAILTEHSFKNVDHSLRILHEFVFGPGFGHVSNRTVDLALQLVSRMLNLCPKVGAKYPPYDANSRRLSDPDRVLTRLENFVAVYGGRSTLIELWNSNPSLFELLLLLFDRSEFLAEVAIRTPDLVDELELSGRLRQRKSATETLADLRHGLADADQYLWLRRYHQAELMRIGLRDILGLADFEQNLVELSALADACLQYALEVVLHKRKLKKSPFVIIGLGKIGGVEINYGSDLDIVFVTNAKASDLPKLQAIAVDVMDLVSARTEAGTTFPTDARLRPDGEKGLLVNTLGAYEDYYRHRAQLWEIQSITRTRPIAGDLDLGVRFQEMVRGFTDFTSKGDGIWKSEINRMRARIEKERTPHGQDDLAIKTGSGGLMDAEFLAQTFCLENGWHEPNTLRALQLAQSSKVLAHKDASQLIENYRRLRRIEGILRRWSFEGETVLPDDPAPYYRVAIRCGFSGSEEFRAALASWRKAIRAVYNRVFAC